jgi:hypothetical protein
VRAGIQSQADAAVRTAVDSARAEIAQERARVQTELDELRAASDATLRQRAAAAGMCVTLVYVACVRSVCVTHMHAERDATELVADLERRVADAAARRERADVARAAEVEAQRVAAGRAIESTVRQVRGCVIYDGGSPV